MQRKAVGGIPFEQGIAAPEREFWAKNAEAGVKIVPPITAGGDSRPRLEWPMPWGRRLPGFPAAAEAATYEGTWLALEGACAPGIENYPSGTLTGIK